MKHRIWKSH